MTDPHTTFLFWNVRKHLVTQNLVRLVEGHKVHVLLLAEGGEFRKHPEILLNALNAGPQLGGWETFSFVEASGSNKVLVFHRLKHPNWTVKASHEHYDVWSLVTDAKHRLVLTAAHFPSVQEDQGDGQRKVAIELQFDLRKIEAREDLLREDKNGQKQAPFSLVVGDLNANPFDPGIAGIYGLNASLSRDVVHRGNGIRELHKRSYPFFYNPMWRFFGTPAPSKPLTASDLRKARVYGTYYNRLEKPVCYDWFILDQVLMRQNMLPYFKDQDVRILTHDAEQGGVPLISKNGIPRKDDFSDHLPLLFHLSL